MTSMTKHRHGANTEEVEAVLHGVFLLSQRRPEAATGSHQQHLETALEAKRAAFKDRSHV